MKDSEEKALQLRESATKLVEKESALRSMAEALAAEEVKHAEADASARAAEARHQEAMRVVDRTRERFINEARGTQVKAVEDFLRSEFDKFMRMGFSLDDRGAGFVATLGQLKKANRLTSEYNFDVDMDIGADVNKQPISEEDTPMSVLKGDEFWPLVCPKEDPPKGMEDPRVPLVLRFSKWVPTILSAGCLEAIEESEWMARNERWVKFEEPIAVSPPPSPGRIENTLEEPKDAGSDPPEQ